MFGLVLMNFDKKQFCKQHNNQDIKKICESQNLFSSSMLLYSQSFHSSASLRITEMIFVPIAFPLLECPSDETI